MDNITQDKEIVKGDKMSDKFKTIEDVQVELTPEQYKEQKKVFEDTINCNYKASDYVYIRKYEYTKIQNYIEAIRLIAEKVGTAETDCIEQLARDVGTYLYDLAEGEKDD